jgi:hypothetical protein
MIGAGIFALLGEAGAVAGAGVWLVGVAAWLGYISAVVIVTAMVRRGLPVVREDFPVSP